MAYEIKKGEPMLQLGAPRKFPWEELEIGDCFDVPVTDSATSSLRSGARHWSLKLSRKFTVLGKAVPGHTRVQRIS